MDCLLTPPSDVTQPTADLPAVPAPFDLEHVLLTRREHIALKCEAQHYKSMHARAVKRIESLKIQHAHEVCALKTKINELEQTLEDTQAQLRGLRRQAFGTRSERAKSLKKRFTQPTSPPVSRRKRGQQPGWQGHGRTRETELPVREQTLTLDGCTCPQCGLGLTAIAGTQDAEILEIEVQAYRRKIRRTRYRPLCQCGVLPGLVMPPPPPQLIARGKLGTSVLVEALLAKYRDGQPIHRLLAHWHDLGLDVAAGTLTQNLQQLLPLFAPVREAGLARLRCAASWHADETRWEVFESIQGKQGHRWYLWVFMSDEVMHFILDPSRSSRVPKAVLDGVTTGVLSVDRYSAYGKYARGTPGVELALCWAHQRRDFLQLLSACPEQAAWALQWMERIGQLYALHHKRQSLATDTKSDEYRLIDQLLQRQVQALEQCYRRELAQPDLPARARQVLRSLHHYWPGLLTFMAHPLIDLDNNQSERALRPAVVGRKNYYGSGSLASGQLAATMLSVFNTMQRWEINPRRWLTEYLQACAHAGGQPPADCTVFIPWQMTPQRLATLRQGWRPERT